MAKLTSFAHPHLGRHASEEEFHLIGRCSYLPRRRWQQVLRWLSGWALLHGVLRVFGVFLGYRHEVEMWLQPGQLIAQQRRSFFGHPLVQRQTAYALTTFTAISRFTRWSRPALFIGTLCLSLGVFFGGLWMVQGARVADGVVLMVGGAVVALGLVIDFALHALSLRSTEYVGVDFHVKDAPALRITGVSSGDVARFLDALANQGATLKG